MKGWAELLLCGAVIVAGWTRTPVGALATNGWRWARGAGETVDVLASFRTELPARVTDSLDRALAAGRGDLPAEGPVVLDALGLATRAHLGEEAWAQLAPELGRPGADPEAVLETWAIGAELRERAVGRARAAGEAHPERLAAHRRFLPAEAAAQASRAAGETLALATVLDLRWPVDASARITSAFGYRTHPVRGTRKLHEGVDIAVPEGTTVSAAGAGRVSRSREDAVNGIYVVVDHGHGVTTAYCHGSAAKVDQGAAVERGEHILDSGNSGRSTGPHLHFGLRIEGRPVDPAPFRAATALSRREGERGEAG